MLFCLLYLLPSLLSEEREGEPFAKDQMHDRHFAKSYVEEPIFKPE